MTNEASLREWLSEQCPSVWSLLNNQARRQLPFGLLEYLSPLSEEQLDVRAEEIPELSSGYLLAPLYREQRAQPYAEHGRQNLLSADKHIKALIDICGSKPVGNAYRKDLSGVHTGDQLAEILCEIMVCSAVRALSSLPPQLRPSSGRPGRKTSCDVFFEVAGVPLYGEVKRYPDPWLRERASTTKDHLQPIDLYRKLEGVPEQFPEGTVNLLFVYRRSLPQDPGQALHQALFGWSEKRHAVAQESGLFARADWPRYFWLLLM